jgi:tetratricopeptide (TPR) repeat protein
MFAIADESSDLSTSLAYKAIERLQESANMAKDRYPTMYVDSCEDIAQTYYQLGNYKYAQLWLERALAVIPREYMFEEGKGVPTIPDESLVEEDFLGLGKIELTYGLISYEVGLKNGNGQVPLKDLAVAMRHFIFSSAYFELFSSRAAGRETAYKQLYERFKKCKYEDLRYLQKELIPKIAQDFGLDPKWINGFFEDTLGLALQLEQWRQP